MFRVHAINVLQRPADARRNLCRHTARRDSLRLGLRRIELQSLGAYISAPADEFILGCLFGQRQRPRRIRLQRFPHNHADSHHRADCLLQKTKI